MLHPDARSESAHDIEASKLPVLYLVGASGDGGVR
jgi:hypothetical protein